MTEANNTVDDFPAATFTIFVYCDACEHSDPLDRTKVLEGMTVEELRKVLRCSSCGSHDA